MCFKKRLNRTDMRFFTILMLSTFLLSIGPVGHTAEDLTPGEGKASSQDILAENVFLTTKLAELDIPSEAKIEILGNALSWEFLKPETVEGEFDAITTATPRVCNQYLQTALILDTIDFFITPCFLSLVFTISVPFCVILV